MSKPKEITVNLPANEVATIRTVIRYNEKKLEMTGIYYNYRIEVDPKPKSTDEVWVWVHPPGSRGACWHETFKDREFQEAIKAAVAFIRLKYANF